MKRHYCYMCMTANAPTRPLFWFAQYSKDRWIYKGNFCKKCYKKPSENPQMFKTKKALIAHVTATALIG